MKKLFESVKIRDLELSNRFVRSATYDAGTVAPGHVSDYQLKLYGDLAKSGIGLIISGVMYVHPGGRFTPFLNAIDSDACIPGLKRLTATIHDHETKIAAQLHHAGRLSFRGFTDPDLMPLAPSVINDDPHFQGKCRKITEEEIRETIAAYGDAAARAKEAGFDAVQIHSGHGYLLSQFLSPFTNRRTDAWGGSPENRRRLHLEIMKDIRAKTGDDFPVMIKLGVADDIVNGMDLEEGLAVAKALAATGIDCIEPSVGLRGSSFDRCEFKTGINSIEKEAYFRDWSSRVKKELDIPVMAMGGIRTYALMEEIISRGEADFISLCRPLIREPSLVKVWNSGNLKKCDCISCNKCLEIIRQGTPLYCPVEKKKREKAARS